MKLLSNLNVYYDKSTNKHRDKLTNKSISQDKLKKVHQWGVKQYVKETARLVAELSSSKINFLDFQKQVAINIKDIRIFALEVAKGGKENTFAIDYLTQARRLKNVDYVSLRRVFSEISLGIHSEKMIAHRLNGFGISSSQAFEEGLQTIAISKGDTHMVRILGVAEHCDDCVRYSSLGVAKIGDLPLPTEECECRLNCKCSVLYGSLEDLIKR